MSYSTRNTRPEEEDEAPPSPSRRSNRINANTQADWPAARTLALVGQACNACPAGQYNLAISPRSGSFIKVMLHLPFPTKLLLNNYSARPLLVQNSTGYQHGTPYLLLLKTNSYPANALLKKRSHRVQMTTTTGLRLRVHSCKLRARMSVATSIRLIIPKFVANAITNNVIGARLYVFPRHSVAISDV